MLTALGCGSRVGTGPAHGGMTGVSSAEMSTYRDMFNRHTQLHRMVTQVPGGVSTTTESDDPGLTAQLQAHVAAMFQQMNQGQEISCMSPSLPILFRNRGDYSRQLTLIATGVMVTEISSDPHLAQAIRDHADEISGFVQEGMPANMRGMMGGG